jgi:hypothetical protein
MIGIAGGHGNMEDIPEDRVKEISVEYETAVDKNIRSQKSKLCLPCFKQLSKEDQQKEVWLHE